MPLRPHRLLQHLFCITILAACGVPRVYYISHPAHTRNIDTRAWAVPVFIEDRTLMWMNAAAQRTFQDTLEAGACGHVAKMVGDGVYIDSLIPARGLQFYTPTRAHFSCYTNEVPIHWHPRHVCRFSDGNDLNPAYSVFPAIVMQCGTGIDSVYAVKVRNE